MACDWHACLRWCFMGHVLGNGSQNMHRRTCCSFLQRTTPSAFARVRPTAIAARVSLAMRLVLISQPAIFPGEPKLAASLLRNGAATLHLRKPDARVEDVARLLDEIPSDLHPRIMLHQHHQLAERFEVKGLHYPERVRPPAPIARLANPKLLQSTSFHKLEDLEHDDPAHWGPGLTYAFLSPIFDSISKQGYAAAGFDPDRLRTALRRFKTPVVALGGITAERVSQASELGFEGVAVLGAVWQAQDPVAAMEQLLAACEACGAREPQLS